MIYDKSGTQVFDAFDIDGNELQTAYDINGNTVFQKSPTTIKVMTYNVGQWYIGNGNVVPSADDEKYYNLQNGIIQRADADILFINEYRDQFSGTGRTALSLLSQYFPYIETRNGASGYMGRAICSKYPLSNYAVQTFTDSSYYYDKAEITINGRNIVLVVIHLTPKSGGNVQAQQLCNYLKTLNTFICGGDFNTGFSPSRDNDNTESTNYAQFVKLFTDEGFRTANFGKDGFMVTCNDGVDGTGVDWDIDNIITSSDISVLSASVDTTKLTDNISAKIDHMPLIAELQI